MVNLGPVAPTRYLHLSRSNASLAVWERAGYDLRDVREYLEALEVSANRSNNAQDLRIQHSGQYLCVQPPSPLSLARMSWPTRALCRAAR